MKCCDCGNEKPASEFNRRPNRPKGFTSYCRGCLRKRWRKWAYGEQSTDFHISADSFDALRAHASHAATGRK